MLDLEDPLILITKENLVVYKGLLDLYPDDADLAAIFSHHLGHFIAGLTQAF